MMDDIDRIVMLKEEIQLLKKIWRSCRPREKASLLVEARERELEEALAAYPEER